jgi:hypothetical protein
MNSGLQEVVSLRAFRKGRILESELSGPFGKRLSDEEVPPGLSPAGYLKPQSLILLKNGGDRRSRRSGPVMARNIFVEMFFFA